MKNIIIFQLLEALREQEVCNFKLKQYINGILMRVITLHPEILEIPAPAEDSRGMRLALRGFENIRMPITLVLFPVFFLSETITE